MNDISQGKLRFVWLVTSHTITDVTMVTCRPPKQTKNLFLFFFFMYLALYRCQRNIRLNLAGLIFVLFSVIFESCYFFIIFFLRGHVNEKFNNEFIFFFSLSVLKNFKLIIVHLLVFLLKNFIIYVFWMNFVCRLIFKEWKTEKGKLL